MAKRSVLRLGLICTIAGALLAACRDEQAGPQRHPPLGGQLREYPIRRTPTPPTLDGNLTDEVWKQAPAVELVDSLTGGKARHQTVARMLYDEKSLYLSFQSQAANIWASHIRRDEALYEEEVVEIFIDANADGKTYNEIEVSPRNVLFDAYFPARRQGMDLLYDSGTQSAVKFVGPSTCPMDTDEGWDVEMKIPFSHLSAVNSLPPKPGERWRFNLYRLDHSDYQVEGLAFSPPKVGISTRSIVLGGWFFSRVFPDARVTGLKEQLVPAGRARAQALVNCTLLNGASCHHS